MIAFLKKYAQIVADGSRPFFSSNRFFYGTLALLVFEAGWIALTSVYPQAFDEQFHVGIIKLYAQQWSPFFASQPPHADVFGAVARDPSYMYHYLLSFPYRLLVHFVHGNTTQIIVLRFINIGLMAGALYLYRRLMFMIPLSRAVSHALLLLFVLTPVVPLLAAQINYDNLVIPLTAYAVLLTVQLLGKLRTQRLISTGLSFRLLIVCLFASLVKYAFLPIFMAIFAIVAVEFWRQQRKLMAANRLKLQPIKRWIVITYSAATLILIGLFTAMYGINTIRYHTPVPDCSQVIGVKACLKYPPWARNYQFAHTFPRPTHAQILAFPFKWVQLSLDELTYAISSNFESDGATVDYYTESPLPVMIVLAWTGFSLGVILLLLYFKQLWANVVTRSFMIISAVYMAVLFLQNLSDYMHTGQPVAIHGRYLLPILPLLYAIFGLSLQWFIARQQTSTRQLLRTSQLGVFMIALVLMTQGSGFITYIMRSNSSWFWPQSKAAPKVNHTVKKVLRKVIVGAPRN